MRRISIVALALLLVVCATALARRRASAGERTAVVNAAVAQSALSHGQGACVEVYISTVSSHWASIDFPQPPKNAHCAALAANGVLLMHRVSGHWKYVAGGSDFRCPIRGVPTPVARDLRVC